jgi:serine/threonine protein kinase
MIIIKQIGRGGFGNVDLVQDKNGKQFARKTFSVNQPGHFPPELVENVKKRFIREANVQAALSHNNIMPIYETELVLEPPSFIMPVAISSLDDDIRLDKSLNGYAISAVMDILAGLEELHHMGITHRDLKPQNVLRLPSQNGHRYVISDFGLMSIKDTQLSVLTQTGMRMGSDYYTAPEIVADLRMASPRSDIYSVGCILHDLFKTVDRIPCNEIHDTGHYADIILCCTRRDPNRRFQSVSDLRDAILSVGQVGLTTSEPQANDFISLLLSTDVIDPLNWERIVDKIERLYPSNDATALLSQISLNRISEVVTSAPVIASRLGIIYSV